jgi:hypothetical protein
VTSGFRRDADENYTFLGYNAASSGNPLPTFRDNISVPSSRVKKSKKRILLGLLDLLEPGLPLDAALYPRRAQFSKQHKITNTKEQ